MKLHALFCTFKSRYCCDASVEEAQSATKADVCNYLKADLKVGEGNFPTYIVLCGDQQTYSIMVN